MPFKRSKKLVKRPVRKTRKPTRKYKRSSLVSLIKKVSLKQVETKSVHKIEENVNMFHNLGYIYTNILRTSQGITDTDTGATAYSNRLGDEIIARGISIKLWIANKRDRPNVMYRMFVFKYVVGSIPTSAQLFTGANGNRIMDKLETETFSIVYQKVFNLQNNVSFSDANHTREAHTYRKIWIPLKDKKITYSNGGTQPKFFDYGFFIVPYDSYGTLTTDNIASFAYEQQFYFKDA